MLFPLNSWRSDHSRTTFIRFSHRFQLLKLSKRWLIVATLAAFNLQCSWTPDVETTIYEGPECIIFLKTSQALHSAPKHPILLSPILIETILTGMVIDQEEGILQQLLLSTHHPVRAFSPSQIVLLAPQLSTALSQATPEEIIHFQCQPTNAQSFSVQGTLAVFSPTTLLLTLKNLKAFPAVSQKIQRSSRQLQTTTSLTFVPQDAIIGAEAAQAFMTIPSASHRIAINYQHLDSSISNNKEDQLDRPDTQATPDQTIDNPMATDSLKDQLRDLRKKVDQQAEEIRRLQHNSYP